MDKLGAKLIALFILIVLTLTFSVLPYFLVPRGSRSLVSDRRRDKVIALLNCFGGGVFLGTLLLHLMTEGADQFEIYKFKTGWTTEFPLFNIFVAAGFFVVAFIEFFMHTHLHHKHTKHIQVHTSEQGNSQENDNVYRSQYGSVERQVGSSSFCSRDSNINVDNHETDKLLHGRHSHNASGDSANGSSIDDRNVEHQHEHPSCEIESQKTESSRSSQPPPAIPNVLTEFPDGLRAILLLTALSFHTIFDGLAVGLQSSISEIWQVFTAIAIHKSIVAFCLGLEIFKSQPNTPWKALALVCFFSLMSPIGIALGIGLTSSGISEVARLLSSSILQGIAAGTFLYVTFLEILNMYIGHNCHRKFVNIFAALVGFSFMACVKLLDD